ncbi:MAG TPA: 6-phosphogluconolactonase [Caulobacteraceae bacterium]|jgi:6-phosphogluconolactonase
MSSPLDLRAFQDADAWAEATAAFIADGLRAAIAESGRASLAGGGGATPWPVYERLTGADLDWSRVVITLVDERRVPETSAESNARRVKAALLQSHSGAARFAPLEPGSGPREAAPLSVAFIGMGDDGHFASIFPGDPTGALKAGDPRVHEVPAGQGAAPAQPRLTLTLPWFTGAGSVVLAIRGEAKHGLLERAARGEAQQAPISALLNSGAPLTVFWAA